MGTTGMLLVLAGGIGLILLLTIKFKLHAFLALLSACFFIGFFTGMPFAKIFKTIEVGMGDSWECWRQSWLWEPLSAR